MAVKNTLSDKFQDHSFLVFVELLEIGLDCLFIKLELLFW